MDHVPPPPVPTQLIVFADDWGRHPSSSQHLIRELLPNYPSMWVNTVGTRKPRLSWADAKRAFKKISNVIASSSAMTDHVDSQLPENLYVTEPFMYPGFRTRWQRRFNRRKLSRAIHGCFDDTYATPPLFTRLKVEPYRRVAITTLPITADLVGKLHVDRWIYYCVDDYSQWPGADSTVMDQMERELVHKVDAITCVSDQLRNRIAGMGLPTPSLLSHGVEIGFWQPTFNEDDERMFELPGFMDLNGSPVVFWGLIDERLDQDWIAALSKAVADKSIKICLIGPTVGEKARWEALTHDPRAFGEVVCCGAADYDLLPKVAHYSQVLIMPYIDAPVTRAMQPLKLLEYLATMKPVVVRDLPSTRLWADCCDLASDAASFVGLVAERCETGTPPKQIVARRRRLASESWTAKAIQLAELINAE